MTVWHELYAGRRFDPDDEGPGFEGSSTRTARRTGGGNAANGFHSMSSGGMALKSASPGWCDLTIAFSYVEQESRREFPIIYLFLSLI
jgi:hypothetical protein